MSRRQSSSFGFIENAVSYDDIRQRGIVPLRQEISQSYAVFVDTNFLIRSLLGSYLKNTPLADVNVALIQWNKQYLEALGKLFGDSRVMQTRGLQKELSGLESKISQTTTLRSRTDGGKGRDVQPQVQSINLYMSAVKTFEKKAKQIHTYKYPNIGIYKSMIELVDFIDEAGNTHCSPTDKEIIAAAITEALVESHKRNQITILSTDSDLKTVAQATYSALTKPALDENKPVRTKLRSIRNDEGANVIVLGYNDAGGRFNRYFDGSRDDNGTLSTVLNAMKETDNGSTALANRIDKLRSYVSKVAVYFETDDAPQEETEDITPGQEILRELYKSRHCPVDLMGVGNVEDLKRKIAFERAILELAEGKDRNLAASIEQEIERTATRVDEYRTSLQEKREEITGRMQKLAVDLAKQATPAAVDRMQKVAQELQEIDSIKAPYEALDIGHKTPEEIMATGNRVYTIAHIAQAAGMTTKEVQSKIMSLKSSGILAKRKSRTDGYTADERNLMVNYVKGFKVSAAAKELGSTGITVKNAVLRDLIEGKDYVNPKTAKHDNITIFQQAMDKLRKSLGK